MKTSAPARVLTLALTFSLLATLSFAGKVDRDLSFYRAPENGDRYTLPAHEDVTNVILMIGDGTSFAQVSAARIAALGPSGRLHLDKMPVTGIMTTHSRNRLITDSAAGATAMATGRKTDNKMVGVLPDTTVLTSLMEIAMADGLGVGVVATSTVTHATPASFLAHEIHRNHEDRIAEDMAASGADVIFGGGRAFFIPDGAEGSVRDDERDLLGEMARAGYEVVTTRRELMDVKEPPVIGLFGDRELMFRAEQEPTLAEMTDRAIELLAAQGTGFFLMVEGSQIDWAGHDNEEDEMVRQTLLFDEALGRAMEFAERDGHTLVIVTADHETGGATLVKGNRDGSDLVIDFSTTSHTALPVPVFAAGPGALRFTGLFDNTELPRKIAALTGLDGLPEPRPDDTGGNGERDPAKQYLEETIRREGGLAK